MLLQRLDPDAPVYCSHFDDSAEPGNKIQDYEVNTVSLTQAGGKRFVELELKPDTDPTAARRN